MKPALSTRQAEVAEYVARCLPDKVIAHHLGIDVETVRFHIKAAVANIPGPAKPREKLMLWFLNVLED